MFEYILKMCDMGGYGVYIWPSYALLLAVITWQIFTNLNRNLSLQRRVKEELESKRDQES